MRWLRAAWGVLRAVAVSYFTDQIPRAAAALAYYTVFSIAPLLIIATAVAGLVFGEEAAQGRVAREVGGLVGPQGARAIQDLVLGAAQPGSGLWASLIGFGILLFGASFVFGELQTTLNQLWGAKARPDAGWKEFLRARFLSFSMVLVTGFLLLVSLVLSAALAGLTAWLAARWPEAALVAEWTNVLTSWLVTIALFALIYRFLPDVRLGWGDVTLGAVVTAGLFTVGKWGIGLYLGTAAGTSAYGAIGSLVVLLIWVYYSSQIFYIGAEFTKALATRRHPIEPKPHATGGHAPPHAVPT